MFVYTLSDGVVSTRQVLLHDSTAPENLENLWELHAVTFYNRKNMDPESLAHAEFMNMKECQRVRRYMFYYDLSEKSKNMFKDVLSRTNPKMSILIVLAPRTNLITSLYPKLEFPTLINTHLEKTESIPTGTPVMVLNTTRNMIVTPDDISSEDPDGAYAEGEFVRDVGYVLRIFDNGVRPDEEASFETRMDEVESSGRTTAEQLLHDYLLPHLRESMDGQTSRIYELTYHVNCGGFRRYYLHYDSTLDHTTLDKILDDHSDLPVRTSFRITFVPRTSTSEAALKLGLPEGASVKYPVVIDAGIQEETVPSSRFGGRAPLRFNERFV